MGCIVFSDGNDNWDFSAQGLLSCWKLRIACQYLKLSMSYDMIRILKPQPFFTASSLNPIIV